MGLTLGYLKSPTLVELKIFPEQGEQEQREVELVDLEEENLGLLFVDDLDEAGPDVKEFLKEQEKYYAVLEAKAHGQNFSSFCELQAQEAKNLVEETRLHWSKVSQLKTLEGLVPTCQYLAKLWREQRQKFVEELWYLIHSNWNSQDLTVLFHDLAPQEEGQKAKLSVGACFGPKKATVESATEAQQKLFETYAKQMGKEFTLFDYTPPQASAGVLIQEGPLLILSEQKSLGQLQLSLIKSVVRGVNQLLD
jgi:hypothetical protein